MKISPAKLRQLRRRQGWTQRDLADHLGVDPMSVSRWERGLSYPQRPMRGRLQALLTEVPAEPTASRHPIRTGLSPSSSASERVDELVRAVGLKAALHALREIALLARKPAPVRFADDPTRRMREVETALREQSALITRARIG